MNKEEINVNELIKVESLPKIMYQLEIIGEQVDKALVGVDSMECTEENKQEVKRRKQDITKFKSLMEEKRKEIKNKILEPYNIFNEKYEQEIKNKLSGAEDILNNKIKVIENSQLEEKRNELYDFAQRQIETNNLQEFINFDTIGLNITLSASIKSLKEQIKEYVDKTIKDIELINTQEFNDEIMVEYKKDLNLSRSILEVKQRKEELKKLEELKAKREEEAKQQQEIIQNVEKALEQEIVAPKEIVEEEKPQLLEVTFTIKGTKEQILGLKQYIIDNKIEYW